MTKEGVLRENYLYRGSRADTEIWAVLAPNGARRRRLKPPLMWAP
ncbi:hypothetical protein STANM309S_05825 [Streptomyces tanashiensis]